MYVYKETTENLTVQRECEHVIWGGGEGGGGGTFGMKGRRDDLMMYESVCMEA
jgi:hypothetical protein